MIGTIRNLTTNNLEQQLLQSQSFTSNSDEDHHISIGRPVNYREINLDNTNINTSNMSEDLRDKNTDLVLKKSNDNSISEQLEELKKKMTSMLSSSVRVEKQAKRFVKLRRIKVSVLQIQ